MESGLTQNLTIELNTQGRNTIPYVDSGNIITIHGKNGVGKSMAAMLLEIASGNYIFQNENRFQKLKNVIESCEIQFKMDGSLLYKVILKPHLWKFDKNLNSINPLTLGNFYKEAQKKEKEIDFDEFKRNINIRTIRGNESLQQQIFFFKDIFVAKINQKLKKLEEKIIFLEKYQNWLNINKLEKNIEDYNHLQQEYNDQLNMINNFENNIRNREANLKNLEKKLNLLEKLIIITNNDIDILIKERELEEKKLNKTNNEIEVNYKELSNIKDKLDELTTQFDKKTKETLKSLTNLRNKKENLKEQLGSQYDLHLDKKFEGKSDQHIKEIKENIKNYQDNITKCKEDIEKLNKKNERIIEINKYLTQLRDICSKASSYDFGKEKLINIITDKKSSLSFSFQELFEIFRNSNIEFKQDEKLKEYQENVQNYNDKIQENRKKLDALVEYNKILEKIAQLEQLIKNKGSKIDNFVDLDTRLVSLENKRKDHEKTIDNLNKDILAYNQKIQDLNITINQLKDIPTQSSLLKDLEKLGIIIGKKELSMQVFKEKSLEVQKKIKQSQIELKSMNKEKDTTKLRLEKTKNDLDKSTKEIKKAGQIFGYTQLGKFLDYFKPHIEKFRNYMEKTKALNSRLRILRDDIEKVVEGINPKNKTHLKIINIEFDNIFKQLYERNEFFEYVFKNYVKIKKFDIGNRAIIFETIGGMEETRDLEEFSSGEKTYAYCRSIITLTANIAQYNIVILDESYALLDREHSQNLYQFQKEMVQRKGITKFINILPLKEDLQKLIDLIDKNIKEEEKKPDSSNLIHLNRQLEILQSFQKEISSHGYYQEINYPDKLRKELNMISVPIPRISEPIFPIDTSEDDLGFSFILDGSNIARNNPQSKKASIRDVIRCKEKLKKLGVPEKNILIIFGAGLRHHIPERDKDLYENLLNMETVNQAPAERDDDWFIIKYAFDHQSYIITNDRYLEYREKSSSYDQLIKSHSIHYSIIGRDIIFDERLKDIINSILKNNQH